MYDQYKGQNFEIVGISIDIDKSKWLKAIEKDKMKHQQLIDPKGFDAKTVVLFEVKALPKTYFFKEQEKLIAKNPTKQK